MSAGDLTAEERRMILSGLRRDVRRMQRARTTRGLDALIDERHLSTLLTDAPTLPLETTREVVKHLLLHSCEHFHIRPSEVGL